jgi:CHASE2 domain-containing sensor protein
MNPGANSHVWTEFRHLLGRLLTKEGSRFVLKAFWILLILELVNERVAVDHTVHDTMARVKAVLRQHLVKDAGKVDERIILLRLDDASIPGPPATGVSPSSDPYPREVLARLIDAVADVRPRVIVLDVALESLTSAEADRRLAESIARAGCVVLAQDVHTRAGEGLEVVPLASSFTNLTGAAVAPSFFREDEDRLVRRAPLRLGHLKAEPLTLPAVVAAKAMSEPPHDFPESVRIDFRDRATNCFRSFSAAALLRWKDYPAARPLSFFGASVQPGSVVILGPFYARSHDVFPVPAWVGDEYGEARGALLLACTIQTLLADDRAWEASSWMRHGLTLLFFALAFAGVCVRIRWPEEGFLNWRLFFPALYGFLVAGLVVCPGWFLPLASPVAGYTMGRELGVLFFERFGAGGDASREARAAPALTPSASNPGTT